MSKPEQDKQKALDVAKSGPSGPIPYQMEMEKQFGQNFCDVRVYTGPAAKRACEMLGAKAFTQGNHVVFKDASPSRELIAHELAHVVQQRSGPPIPKP